MTGAPTDRQRRPIDAARTMLGTTRHCVEQIARQTGLGTDANLRQHPQRSIDVAPQAYRRTHQHSTAAAPS